MNEIENELEEIGNVYIKNFRGELSFEDLNLFMRVLSLPFKIIMSDINELTIFTLEKIWEDSDIYKGYILQNTMDYLELAGLVSKVSKYFADKNIPILYTTSYNNDYIFIKNVL